MNKTLIAAAFGSIAIWAALSGPACAEPPFYIEIDTAPRYIERYPHTYYEGRPVYYYDNHWYYRHGDHWAYYREEPPPLVEFRAGPPRRHHPHPPGPGPHHHHPHHHER